MSGFHHRHRSGDDDNGGEHPPPLPPRSPRPPISPSWSGSFHIPPPPPGPPPPRVDGLLSPDPGWPPPMPPRPTSSHSDYQGGSSGSGYPRPPPSPNRPNARQSHAAAPPLPPRPAPAPAPAPAATPAPAQAQPPTPDQDGGSVFFSLPEDPSSNVFPPEDDEPPPPYELHEPVGPAQPVGDTKLRPQLQRQSSAAESANAGAEAGPSSAAGPSDSRTEAATAVAELHGSEVEAFQQPTHHGPTSAASLAPSAADHDVGAAGMARNEDDHVGEGLATATHTLSLGSSEGPPPRPPKSPLGMAPKHQTGRRPSSGPPSWPVPRPTGPPSSPPGTSDPRSPSTAASEPVTSCIDIPVTFATRWYTHPDAPDFPVCSRCYADYIAPSPFRPLFHGAIAGQDDEPRRCRFSMPRIKETLLPRALATGSLDAILEYMRFRTTVPDCKGHQAVVRAPEGVKWFRPRLTEAVPGFVSCQACYVDRIMAHRSLAGNFEPAPPQAANDKWTCDMAVPYIQREYTRSGGKGDWISFSTEARARMSMKPCPGVGRTSTYRQSWFMPVEATGIPAGSLVLCTACYADHVIYSGEEQRWRVAEEFKGRTGAHARCAFGAAFNMRMLIGRCEDLGEWTAFWRAARPMTRDLPFCDTGGIVTRHASASLASSPGGTAGDRGSQAAATWWTLHNDPLGFQVCQACFLAVAEPLGFAKCLMRKRDPGADQGPATAMIQPQSLADASAIRCCFNLAHPRLAGGFLPRLLELYFTGASAALEAYAAQYAALPPCPRDSENISQHARWFGWAGCMACPECWRDLARLHPGLAARAELADTPGASLGPWPAAAQRQPMCELYSPRMRSLFAECASSQPPDPAPLLSFAAHRRAVHAQTVPAMRAMLAEARMALSQQTMLNASSLFHTNSGHLQQIAYGNGPYTYSAPGVGSYANHDLLQGAALGQQAAAIAATAAGRGPVAAVAELEKHWRAVE